MSLEPQRRSNGRPISAEDMTRQIMDGTKEPAPRQEPLAKATADAVNVSADRLIEAIQQDRDEATRIYQAFQSTAEDVQRMISERSEYLASEAGSFINTLTKKQIALEELRSAMTTFKAE